MFIRHIYIVLLMMPLHVVSQVLDTMYFDINWNQANRSEAHYYRYISVDTSEAFRFYVEDYYPDGQIQMRGTYKSIRPDNKDGHFVYWFENGNKQMECRYRDNILHGTLWEWYSSGEPEAYQEFRNGLLNGEYISWRKDGNPKIHASYYNGEKHGNFRSFYPGGQMIRDDYFENGVLIEGRCYSEQGEPVEYFPYVQMPEFPGGQEALHRFIRREMKYPQEARKKGLEGSVIILLTIDNEGYVRSSIVMKGDHKLFNEEAIRISRIFPRWTPGKVDGVPAPIQVSVPFEFRLH
jgi:TonB family protein